MIPSIDALHEQFNQLFPPMDPAPGQPPAAAPAAPAPGHPVAAASAAPAPGQPSAAPAALAPAPVAAAAPSDAVAAPPEPVSACKKIDFTKQGYHLDLTVTPDRLLDAVRELDQHGFSIDYITGVDWPEQQQMEVIYDFFHAGGSARVAVRTRTSRANPEVPTIAAIFPGASWHERETWEFFGIKFAGHPNLIHLLLPDDMEGFPLRKDFKANATG